MIAAQEKKDRISSAAISVGIHLLLLLLLLWAGISFSPLPAGGEGSQGILIDFGNAEQGMGRHERARPSHHRLLSWTRRRLGCQPGHQCGRRWLPCGDTRHIEPDVLESINVAIRQDGPGKSGDGQGHIGNPARATALFGQHILEMQIDDAVKQIQGLRASSRR